ncbi:hypothetical protein CSC14_1659 [Proteus mirabilis]|nr:hypothetical protein CSC14_1659 [Proteus mirabilis]
MIEPILLFDPLKSMTRTENSNNSILFLFLMPLIDNTMH